MEEIVKELTCTRETISKCVISLFKEMFLNENITTIEDVHTYESFNETYGVSVNSPEFSMYLYVLEAQFKISISETEREELKTIDDLIDLIYKMKKS